MIKSNVLFVPNGECINCVWQLQKLNTKFVVPFEELPPYTLKSGLGGRTEIWSGLVMGLAVCRHVWRG